FQAEDGIRDFHVTGVQTCALPISAGELYQWKDANGVTHYSDAPPPAGADYQNRTIRNSGTASIKTETTETPAENAQCTTARANRSEERRVGKEGRTQAPPWQDAAR